MVSDWPTVPLGSLAADQPNALVGGPFGSNLLAGDRVAEGVPVIQGANMSSGCWLGGDFRFVTEEKADSLAANVARFGDVIFTQRGTLGQVALVPDTYPRYVVSQSQMKLTPNTEAADARYLYYYFSAPAQVAYAKAHAIQTGVPHTNLGILRAWPVVLPPLAEQRAIAALLGALDDKIESNRRMNAVLDEVAQATFHARFVYGRRSMESGEPASADPWRVGSLDQVLSIVREPAHPDCVDPETLYVGLEHFDRGSTCLSRWDVAKTVTSGKSRFRTTDILFGKLRPYFHKVVLAPIDGICSTDVMVLRPSTPHHVGFALGHVNSDTFVSYASARSEGTRMPRTKWRDVAAYPIALPPEELMAEYNGVVSPMRSRQVVCVRESRRLAELRDSLLPRLLSGELRIRGVEATVEEAV